MKYWFPLVLYSGACTHNKAPHDAGPVPLRMNLSWSVFFFESYFLQYLFLAPGLHEDRGAKIAILRLQITDAEFGTAIGSFVNYTETLYTEGIEKILEHNFGLAAAIRIAFFVQGDFNHIIEVLRKLVCVSRFNGRYHVVD